ncbi:MAG: hypothetical protein HY562_10300 [Ignavibacteriales bacterium]|nr:hypothetical protein [Ignavibacteriales bacterium]
MAIDARIRRFVLAILLSVVAVQSVFTQCDGKIGADGLSWDFDDTEKEGFSIGGFIGDMFTPQVVIDTRLIRAYVRDARFKELTRRCGDMRTVDGIYLKALKIAEYRIGRALFLSMMAVLEHQKVDLKMPLISSLPLPLTFEEDTLFRMRKRNLPTRIYADSPQTEEGDKDKLQHFFASAYLSYVSESQDLTRTTGNIVEWGEARFVVGGADDPRDKRANEQGEAFGRDLHSVKTLLPSDYLTLVTEEHED